MTQLSYKHPFTFLVDKRAYMPEACQETLLNYVDQLFVQGRSAEIASIAMALFTIDANVEIAFYNGFMDTLLACECTEDVYIAWMHALDSSIEWMLYVDAIKF
jgi:hypothetical protein